MPSTTILGVCYCCCYFHRHTIFKEIIYELFLDARMRDTHGEIVPSNNDETAQSNVKKSNKRTCKNN